MRIGQSYVTPNLFILLFSIMKTYNLYFYRIAKDYHDFPKVARSKIYKKTRSDTWVFISKKNWAVVVHIQEEDWYCYTWAVVVTADWKYRQLDWTYL